jgi:hypothetical protein
MFENFIDSIGVKIWTTRTGEGHPEMLCNGRTIMIALSPLSAQIHWGSVQSGAQTPY